MNWKLVVLVMAGLALINCHLFEAARERRAEELLDEGFAEPPEGFAEPPQELRGVQPHRNVPTLPPYSRLRPPGPLRSRPPSPYTRGCNPILRCRNGRYPPPPSLSVNKEYNRVI